MKTPVASAKPGSSVVVTTDMKTGKLKYFASNRSIVTYENRETGFTKCCIIDRLTVKEHEVDIWDLAKRRYKRAVRIFRQRIDEALREVYTDIPIYRDSDVSDILLHMNSLRGEKKDVALGIYEFIERTNNGKQKDFPTG